MRNGDLSILRADDRQVVQTLHLGPTLTHQAKPSPDGSVLLVAQLASMSLIKVAADEAAESWQVAGSLSFASLGERRSAPCSETTANGVCLIAAERDRRGRCAYDDPSRHARHRRLCGLRHDQVQAGPDRDRGLQRWRRPHLSPRHDHRHARRRWHARRSGLAQLQHEPERENRVRNIAT